jgi:hypothetical protein
VKKTGSSVGDRLKLFGCASLFVALPAVFLGAIYVINQLTTPGIRTFFVGARGSIVMLLGACAAGYGGWLIWKSAKQFLNWRRIDAVVTHAAIHEVLDRRPRTPGDIAFGPHDHDWQTEYRVGLRYAYEVAGERYTGEWSAVPYVRGVRFRRPDFSSRRDAEAVVRDYPAGAPLTVFYNPQNPSESTVCRGFFSRGLVFAAAGTAAACVGWYLR